MVLAIDIVHKFAPAAKAAYVTAFEDPSDLLAAAHIDQPLRLAHFMAQCFEETGALQTLVESGKYSRKNLGDAWDNGNWHKYFADRAACVAMADISSRDDGVTLFNLVYGDRMGNGPPPSGDGWKFRGRGILQTTGRDSYRDFGDKCGVDFEGDPDLVVSAEHALKPALTEWSEKNLNTAADHNDIKTITRGINGGYNGLADRKAWFAKIWPYVIGAAPVGDGTTWRVQEVLIEKGYDCGEPDGVIGPQTRAAILAYRTDHNLASSMSIGSDLLLDLGLKP